MGTNDDGTAKPQSIARGPVAAVVAIKHLGTNGGGFFGPNSAHPFENPTAWTNVLECVCIILIPMAVLVMFGRMLRNMRHAAVDLRRLAGRCSSRFTAWGDLPRHGEAEPGLAGGPAIVDANGKPHR